MLSPIARDDRSESMRSSLRAAGAARRRRHRTIPRGTTDRCPGSRHQAWLVGGELTRRVRPADRATWAREALLAADVPQLAPDVLGRPDPRPGPVVPDTLRRLRHDLRYRRLRRAAEGQEECTGRKGRYRSDERLRGPSGADHRRRLRARPRRERGSSPSVVPRSLSPIATRAGGARPSPNARLSAARRGTSAPT